MAFGTTITRYMPRLHELPPIFTGFDIELRNPMGRATASIIGVFTTATTTGEEGKL